MKTSAPPRLNAQRFFGKHGELSRWQTNFEFREGQLEMALAVESALADRRHLIVEAGTGTGKTLAYLVPAILSGKRVVISTGTRNLQEQLFLRDIPFLEKKLGPIRACLMKGRNNYACRRKVYDSDRTLYLSGMEELTEFRVIKQWMETTETGDRSEIRMLPENSAAWGKIDARRDLCTGTKCADFENCFITQMQQRAAVSDLIIVNHHLFFADLALKGGEFGSIIPEYDAVIFDEAHEIEDVAGQYFGSTVSNLQVEELRRDVLNTARAGRFTSDDLEEALRRLWEKADTFFALFGDVEGRTAFREHETFREENSGEYADLLDALQAVHRELNLVENAPEELLPLLRRTDEIYTRLRTWLEEPAAGSVYWVERRGRATFLQATPIDVGPLLRGQLFDRINTVIMTSATLAVAGSFDYAQQRLGVQGARTLIVESPFDYETQALLYIPKHMPDPRSPDYRQKAAEEIVRLLQLSRGRAFVLFTSYAQMQQIHGLVEPEIEYPTFVQGTAPRSVLLEDFRSTPNAVLFATSAFWQGVDVQGEQLSCVIIDKLPFAVPSDPIVAARSNAVRESGGAPFTDYQIPQAALALKQGFGRLIRSRTDRGILSILDRRIAYKHYGQIFYDSLPVYGFTYNLEDVERFFAKEAVPATAPHV